MKKATLYNPPKPPKKRVTVATLSSTRISKDNNEENIFTKPIIALLVVTMLFFLFNQYQIMSVSAIVGSSAGGSLFSGQSTTRELGSVSLEAIDLSTLKSTGHTIASVFPVENIVTSDDAVAMLFPTGTPDYGQELGVSFDTPIESLEILARMYPGLKAEVQRSNPEGFQRFMNLASKPVGISCEYCCGVGPIGIDGKGNSICGCQHNPALLSVALYLSSYTDYNDGEILREVMRWKTLFFPKNMVELGMTVAGGDTSALNNLPGMVGGC